MKPKPRHEPGTATKRKPADPPGEVHTPATIDVGVGGAGLPSSRDDGFAAPEDLQLASRTRKRKRKRAKATR